MNYSELVDLIGEYAENEETSFVDNIPNFVRLAEERIYRLVKLPKLRKVSTSLTTTNGVRTVAAPSDFLAVDSLSVLSGTTYTYLINKEPDFIREAYPSSSTTGLPVYYALLDHETFLFGPTPDATYSLELHYLHKPTSIVTSSTSWIGDNAEVALLYGSLVEAYTYMKGEDDMMRLYEQRFMEAVGRAKTLAEGRDRTDSWRETPPKAPID